MELTTRHGRGAISKVDGVNSPKGHLWLCSVKTKLYGKSFLFKVISSWMDFSLARATENATKTVSVLDNM